jgi:hypothetical protein
VDPLAAHAKLGGDLLKVHRRARVTGELALFIAVHLLWFPRHGVRNPHSEVYGRI